MAENGRILTTHVGSLPRPQDVVDVVFAEDRGEEVDPQEYERVIGDAVADRVHHQVDAGDRPRLRRRDEQDRLRHLHPPPPERLRGRRRPARDAGRPRRLPALPRPPRRRGRRARSTCARSAAARSPTSTPSRCERDLAHLHKPRSRASRSPGAFMNAPSPGDHRPVPAQRVLRHARRVPRRDRRGDEDSSTRAIVAAGVQLQIDAPDLAMGRHIMYRDRSDEEFVERAAAPRRGDQPGAARRARRPRARCTCAGATTRARTTSTSTLDEDRRRDPARQAVRRCCSRPPTRATRTSGRCGAQADRSPTTRSSSPACSTRPPTTSSTPSSSPSACAPSPTSSAPDRVIGGHRLRLRHVGGLRPDRPDICWAKLASLAEGAKLASERARS